MRPEGTVKVWRTRWEGLDSMFRKNMSKGSGVGHESAIVNNSKETVGTGKRSSIKSASGAEF